MEPESIRTTVANFNQVLGEVGLNNSYCICPSDQDPNILILKMPRVRGDRSTLEEAVRFTLNGKPAGAREVYFTGNKEFVDWWRGKLTSTMTPVQAHA